jgi:hypothetical protein
MALDLERELLHAAHAFSAAAGQHGFTCAELLGFIEQTRAENAFPRISHRLVAHLVEALAESLVHAGFLERTSPGSYALTQLGVADLCREPGYLVNDPHLSRRK